MRWIVFFTQPLLVDRLSTSASIHYPRSIPSLVPDDDLEFRDLLLAELSTPKVSGGLEEMSLLMSDMMVFTGTPPLASAYQALKRDPDLLGMSLLDEPGEGAREIFLKGFAPHFESPRRATPLLGTLYRTNDLLLALSQSDWCDPWSLRLAFEKPETLPYRVKLGCYEKASLRIQEPRHGL